MLVISPACTNERVTLQSDRVSDVVRAIGTGRYSKACFDVFEQPLEVDHWALFRYNRDQSVNCVATASRFYTLAAKENINRFVGHCYSLDPSLDAVRSLPKQSACVIKIHIDDIRDRQYRYCFNQTHVQERLSFFHCAGLDLYQLSVFRSVGKRPFSPCDMTQFSGLANFVIATAIKHETFKQVAIGVPRHLDLESVEELLEGVPGNLSKREVQVCARVIAGMTIDRTASDLSIKRTSVVTYRQRAYEKLSISRQNELIALVNNLRFNDDAGAHAAWRVRFSG